jgi:WD40 repeat protein
MISNEEKSLNQVKHSSVPNMRTHTSDRGFILRPLEHKRTIAISLPVVSPPKMIQRTIELETQVNDIQISDDSLLLAAACNDRTVKLYDAKGGELEHTLTGCIEHISSVALSPTLIVAGSSSAYVWSLDNKRLRHTMTGHSKHIYAIGIADARIITGSCDRTIKIWELNQGTCLKTLTEAKSIVNDLAISRFSSTFTTYTNSC